MSKVAGIPTASMATSTPAPPVRSMTFCTALPSALLHVPRRAKGARDLQPVLVQMSIITISAGE